MENILEKIKEIASSVFANEVTDKTSQDNCDNWDSLRHLNLVVELEMAFDITFEPEEIAEMKSITAVESMVKTKLTK